MAKYKPRILKHLESDFVLSELSPKEAFMYQKKWLHAFCKPVKKATGKWIYHDFMWHAFSSGIVNAAEGEKALQKYKAAIAAECIILPDFHAWPDEKAVLSKGNPCPDLYDLMMDIYVFPKNFAWSMAFTHEQGWLGPYFVRHSDYKKLNMKNIQMVEAKIKGYW